MNGLHYILGDVSASGVHHEIVPVLLTVVAFQVFDHLQLNVDRDRQRVLVAAPAGPRNVATGEASSEADRETRGEIA
jgi:hypothetical protein